MIRGVLPQLHPGITPPYPPQAPPWLTTYFPTGNEWADTPEDPADVLLAASPATTSYLESANVDL